MSRVLQTSGTEVVVTKALFKVWSYNLNFSVADSLLSFFIVENSAWECNSREEQMKPDT